MHGLSKEILKYIDSEPSFRSYHRAGKLVKMAQLETAKQILDWLEKEIEESKEEHGEDGDYCSIARGHQVTIEMIKANFLQEQTK